MLHIRATYNLIIEGEAKQLGLKITNGGGGALKVVTSPARPITSIAKSI